MGGNFKFQVQDSFLEYFFFEIWRSKKRIALSGKKPPLIKHKRQYQLKVTYQEEFDFKKCVDARKIKSSTNMIDWKNLF